MANYGMKATQSGNQVTSTDITKYVVWTKYPILKVQSAAADNIAGGATDTINHGLGYNPIAMFYIEFPSGSSQFRFVSVAGGAPVYIQNDSSDVNNIYLVNSSPATSYDYFYYIYYDETLA